MPGYKKARNEIRDLGIDEVLVYCVNDPAVMEGWAKDQKIAGTNITVRNRARVQHTRSPVPSPAPRLR